MINLDLNKCSYVIVYFCRLLEDNFKMPTSGALITQYNKTLLSLYLIVILYFHCFFPCKQRIHPYTISMKNGIFARFSLWKHVIERFAIVELLQFPSKLCTHIYRECDVTQQFRQNLSIGDTLSKCTRCYHEPTFKSCSIFAKSKQRRTHFLPTVTSISGVPLKIPPHTG